LSADRTKESSLWGWLRDHVVDLPTTARHLQRIEDSTKSGTPDVEGCIDGHAFWIELKVAYEQRTKGTVRIKTTDKQVYFALKRRKAGGLSWYLIRVGTYPKWAHYLIPGQYAEELLDKPISLARLNALAAVDPQSSAQALMMAASQVERISL
jgi:hypothetical protein